MGDEVTANWIQSIRAGRILAIFHDGTLLVNFDRNRGYSVEPGSTDRGAFRIEAIAKAG
jgi:hypothetical protein